MFWNDIKGVVNFFCTLLFNPKEAYRNLYDSFDNEKIVDFKNPYREKEYVPEENLENRFLKRMFPRDRKKAERIRND